MDFYVSEHYDKHAARKFLKIFQEALHNQQVRISTTDKYSAIEIAILEGIYYGSLS